ncbi:potassium transporter TrkA [Anaerobacillus alkalidiazotrophicus]|uniref:Potassium transporter TrkA n=1 Tax=Anaerobacillus alkalidiazotrophicus TaxID=472963 RepID=A0A1S2MC73_9BACI|nr:TrkA C-terminal domain-containing protein [Anaerobacillus alkalidiazotrophicus]OIJ22200.1 potassium transporter TrkA [Anaerobacillus alkalidiazotrophicus]
MKMKMTDLPGVGKKISFINAENQMMAMIIHHSGKRELYFFEDADDDEAVFTFNLSSEETKQMGAQFLNATLDPVMNEKLERLQLLRKQVIVEWVEIKRQPQFTGKTYMEFEKLLPNGVTVVGLFHDDDFNVSPSGDLTLQKGNTIMVVGKREPIEHFLKICESEAH